MIEGPKQVCLTASVFATGGFALRLKHDTLEMSGITLK